jgi:2-polyprenyl-6-methoxyphenol hydroxylase-like FAD-dependent oxidoreductase
MKHPHQHIAIIGGNFAGLTPAIKLSKRHAVTLIDRSPHFEWGRNIHEILSSVKTPQSLRLDRAAIRTGRTLVLAGPGDRTSSGQAPVAERWRPRTDFRRLHRRGGRAVEHPRHLER